MPEFHWPPALLPLHALGLSEVMPSQPACFAGSQSEHNNRGKRKVRITQKTNPNLRLIYSQIEPQSVVVSDTQSKLALFVVFPQLYPAASIPIERAEGTMLSNSSLDH